MILEGIGIFNGMMFLDLKVAMDLFQMSLESDSHHFFLYYFFFFFFLWAYSVFLPFFFSPPLFDIKIINLLSFFFTNISIFSLCVILYSFL